MGFSAAFRRCLETLDAKGLMKLWGHVAPNMPQPANVHEATISLHHARTQADSMTDAARRYSHDWLVERGLPSGLPAEMLPERPVVVSAIGVAIAHRRREGADKERAGAILAAMTNAAGEMHADGVADPAVIRSHILAARTKAAALS